MVYCGSGIIRQKRSILNADKTVIKRPWRLFSSAISDLNASAPLSIILKCPLQLHLHFIGSIEEHTSPTRKKTKKNKRKPKTENELHTLCSPNSHHSTSLYICAIPILRANVLRQCPSPPTATATASKRRLGLCLVPPDL